MKLISVLLVAVFLSAPALAEEKKKIELRDLGNAQAISPDEEEMARMESRGNKLSAHKIMGFTTLGLMVATALTAKEGRVPAAHKTLGMLSGASYATTAYLSLSAPEPKMEREELTSTKIHKALLFVHLPLMILTPIAGIQAEHQIERGERLHGLAAKKGALGAALVTSVALAVTTMSFEF